MLVYVKTQNLILYSLLCIGLTLFSFTEKALANSKTPFKICYEDIENIPYYYGVGKSIPKKNPGVYLDLLELVAEELNQEFEYYRAPWARCLRDIELNLTDGVLAASYKKERATISHYPMNSGKVDVNRRLVSKSYYLFKHKESESTWDGKKFIHIRIIGAQIGYSIIDFLKKHNLIISETASIHRGFSQLQVKRLDGFITLKEVGESLLLREPKKYSNIVRVEPSIATKPYYLIISRDFYEKYPKRAEEIWNEITHLRDEKIDNFYTRYSTVQPLG